MKYGFITVAAAVPSVKVADTEYNVKQIEDFVAQAEGKGVEIIVFPELSITGYSCQDLFLQQLLIEQSEVAVMQLLDFTRKLDIICIVGAPVNISGSLYNCAIVIQHGVIVGMVPKTYLPNYGEFYEKRWFSSSKNLQPTDIRYAGNTVSVVPDPILFRTSDNVLFGIEICEDVWAAEPCSNKLTLLGADIIFNLSASDELIGKHDYLMSLLSQQSARTISGYVYSGCGFGESTQDVVYGGNALIFENGTLLAESERFSFKPQLVINQIDVEKLRVERQKNTTFVNCRDNSDVVIKSTGVVQMKDFSLMRDINALPFIPSENDMQHSCNEIFSIQVAGLAKRITHTGCKHLIVGISGGLDSTLALLVCVKTFDKLGMSRKGIVGVTMPGFGTTDRTYNNALSLMESLGVTIREINIAESVKMHFNDIGHDISVHDVTYENGQARERTQILMDLSNQLNGMVIGTGDLSELALGWATYNGDHMSMYGINAGIPKTLIKYLVRSVADSAVDEKSRDTLLDIIDTPISPELIPAEEDGTIKQKTEDLVGPYELHDFFLYYFLRFGFRPSKIYLLARKAFDVADYKDETIKHWLKTFFRRFFSQQFKRSCLPDGPKVGSVSLSPRGDWRMPSDASSALWLKECDAL
jgi:NAD+ synthase (glutamine-hydrolysing)